MKVVCICSDLFTSARSVFYVKKLLFPLMETTSNTLQLGMYPVDRTDYEGVKEYLITFGLTPNQIKVFFYLGKIGAKTASEIAKAVKVPRSETYHLLTALQNKGIVEASFQHPIKFTSLSIKKAVHVLLNTETERLNKLKKSGPELEKIWDKIPGSATNIEEKEEEKFKVLQGGNQVNSKIFDMILNAKNECRILGSEKDFMKFYHANFLDALEEHQIDYKLLTPITKKLKYIFDGLDKSKVKKQMFKVYRLTLINTTEKQFKIKSVKLNGNKQIKDSKLRNIVKSKTKYLKIFFFKLFLSTSISDQSNSIPTPHTKPVPSGIHFQGGKYQPDDLPVGSFGAGYEPFVRKLLLPKKRPP